MRALLHRLRDLFRRRTIAREFEEEMAQHVAELEARLIARGATPAEAQAAARREFGNVLQVREDLRTQAGFRFWDELAGDGRNAIRSIGRRPGFAVAIVGILGLGLGAAATLHGLLDAIYLRPLPVPRPTELYAVVNAETDRPSRMSRGTVRRLEEHLGPRIVAAYSGLERCTVQIGAKTATRANIRLVNGGFFNALGITPALGRGFTARDDVAGQPTNVVLVSTAWATQNFGSPASALGQEVLVNRVPMSVEGILPADFRDVTLGGSIDLWCATAQQPALRIFGNSSQSEGDDRPNDPDWNREERISWIESLVRIRPDTPSARMAVERAWTAQRDDLILADTDPAGRERLQHRRWDLAPAPGGRSHFREGFHSTGWLFTGVVAVMLLLVCMNVSGLLLVRSMSRHREIGVRLALGAGSFRVVRLSFVETLFLSMAGGGAGWLLATWLLPPTVRLLAPGQELHVALGEASLLLMAGLILLTALLSALGPALWISRVQPLQALSGSRGLGQVPVRLSRLLVVAQFALAVGLVAVATSLGEEVQRSLAADPGFERDQVMTAAFDPESAGYEAKDVAALLERLRTIALGVPGVKAVGFASNGILAGSMSTSGIHVRHPQAVRKEGEYQHDAFEPGYLRVVGMPVLVGRDFTSGDKAGTQPVALVSASFAREIFGPIDPIGQAFGFDVQASPRDWTIVGIVPDVPVNGLRARAPAMCYFPLSQTGDPSAHFMAVRFDGSESMIQPGLRAALARDEPGLVLGSWKTFQERMTDDLSGDLATTHLAAVFGGCAVLLTGAGVAASLGYLVVLRQRELALRMAIGASPSRMLRSVLWDSLRTSLWGGSLGLAAVWLVPTLPAISTIIHGRPGALPAIVATVVALAAAIVAAWFPARRAACIDPVQMLKSD